MLLAAEVFVALFDGGGGLGLEAAQDVKQLGGVERFQKEVGLGAAVEAGGGDDDDGDLWLEGLDGACYDAAGRVVEAAIENDSADGGEEFEELERLFAAVGGEDVELGGLNHELAGGDAAGEFAVDDEEARP